MIRNRASHWTVAVGLYGKTMVLDRDACRLVKISRQARNVKAVIWARFIPNFTHDPCAWSTRSDLVADSKIQRRLGSAGPYFLPR
jgi:hypothetical protein